MADVSCCLHWLDTPCQVSGDLDKSTGGALWQEQACQLRQDLFRVLSCVLLYTCQIVKAA